MKLHYKILCFVLVAGLFLPLFIVGPNGEPIMRITDWLPTEKTLDSVQDQTQRVIDGASRIGLGSSTNEGDIKTPSKRTASKKSIYKWQDESGTWHFSNTPPGDNTYPVSVESIPEIQNSLPAVDVSSAAGASGTSKPAAGRFRLPSPTTISPGDIPKLFDDAKAIQEKSNNRQKMLNDL